MVPEETCIVAERLMFRLDYYLRPRKQRDYEVEVIKTSMVGPQERAKFCLPTCSQEKAKEIVKILAKCSVTPACLDDVMCEVEVLYLS